MDISAAVFIDVTVWATEAVSISCLAIHSFGWRATACGVTNAGTTPRGCSCFNNNNIITIQRHYFFLHDAN